MERFSARTIDEMGRLALHGDLRQRLGLDTGESVSFVMVGTLVIMQRADGTPAAADTDAISQMNDLGMVTLPKAMRQKLGWREGNKVALYLTDELVIIKSAG